MWRLREICFGRKGTVGAANLLRKRSAIFAFLHVHHEDLKHAIELAGPNLHNAQETWHRVFRDAERAVLQMNRDAFPELLELPSVAREFALWHESGSLAGMRLVPRQLTEIFGDQDGVFPSACRHYRASMNQVAVVGARQGPHGVHREGLHPSVGKPAGSAPLESAVSARTPPVGVTASRVRSTSATKRTMPSIVDRDDRPRQPPARWAAVGADRRRAPLAGRRLCGPSRSATSSESSSRAVRAHHCSSSTTARSR